MKNFLIILTILVFSLTLNAEEEIAFANMKHKRPSFAEIVKEEKIDFRGWDNLVSKLYNEGVSIKDLKRIYASKTLPRFTRVSFSLNPKERKSIYKGFTRRSNITAARNFIKKHNKTFLNVESLYKVSKNIIASILLVESYFGANTGSEVAVYRLSRLANISDPQNLKYNFKNIKYREPKTQFSKVLKRAHYLEDTFLPEIIAIIRISKENEINPFSLKGSSAGAFGWPQFLPSSYIKYAIDYDQDGKRSLYDPEDAIASVANYFKEHGWEENLPLSDKRKVIWKYNKSEAYIDTVLELSNKI